MQSCKNVIVNLNLCGVTMRDLFVKGVDTAILVGMARGFAEAAHNEQLRKYTNTPYIEHPQRVAALIHSHVKDETSVRLMCVALLHDVLEDTPVTHATLNRVFGEDIARTVQELTDQVPKEAGNRAQRKALERARLANCSAAAHTVKCADIIDNCNDIATHDPDFGRVYVRECLATLEVLTRAEPVIRGVAMHTLLEAQTRLREEKS